MTDHLRELRFSLLYCSLPEEKAVCVSTFFPFTLFGQGVITELKLQVPAQYVPAPAVEPQTAESL